MPARVARRAGSGLDEKDRHGRGRQAGRGGDSDDNESDGSSEEGCRSGLQQRQARPDSHLHDHRNDGTDLDGRPLHTAIRSPPSRVSLISHMATSSSGQADGLEHDDRRENTRDDGHGKARGRSLFPSVVRAPGAPCTRSDAHRGPLVAFSLRCLSPGGGTGSGHVAP